MRLLYCNGDERLHARTEDNRVAASFPHITISVAHNTGDGTDSAGDLNSLSIGFGMFHAWLFATIYGVEYIFAIPSSSALAGFPSFPAEMSSVVLDTFSITFTLCLLLLAFSNQILLKFYVSKSALALATCLTAIGTFMLYAVGLSASLGWMVAVVASIAMGIGASLMIVLWGTAFSRYEFTSIILNASIAIVIGLAAYLVLVHWVISPFSGIITGALPIFASLLLWKLTPIPYYRRQETPCFRPLSVRRASFTVRVGIPAFIFGFALGALRQACVHQILPYGDITSQLVVGASACAGVIVVIATVALSKSESHWDMIFRCLTPIIALAFLALPQLGGDLGLLAVFFVVCGCICFEALMWIFLSDMAQEFRLSPIFVFGLGRGFLELGAFTGIALSRIAGDGTLLGMALTPEGSLALMFALVVGYALLPRQREIRAITNLRPFDEPGYNAMISEINQSQEERHAARLAAEAAEEAQPSEETAIEVEERTRAKGRFHVRCEEIADRYMLSRRETEVMFLLAKGHNAAFIQDKLCISKSTAKTHINHIYRKLDIHTQQELLNMVEDRPSGDANSGGNGLMPGTDSGSNAGAGARGSSMTTSGSRDIFEPRRRP